MVDPNRGVLLCSGTMHALRGVRLPAAYDTMARLKTGTSPGCIEGLLAVEIFE